MTEVVGVDGQSLTKNEEVKGKGKETEASTSQPEAEDEQVSRMNGETQAASLVADDNQGAGAAVQTEVVDKEAHRKGKRGPAEDCQELPRDATGAEGTGEKAAKIWSMKCRIVEVNVAPPIGLFDLVGLSSRPIPCKAIGTNRGIQQWTDAALSISVTSLDQFWSIKLKAPPPARSLNSP